MKHVNKALSKTKRHRVKARIEEKGKHLSPMTFKSKHCLVYIPDLKCILSKMYFLYIKHMNEILLTGV